MIRNRMLLLVMGLFIFLSPFSAYAMGIEVAVGGWMQGPSGTMGYKAESTDDILDIENDLKYDDQWRFSGRVKLDMPLFIPNIYIVASPMDFSETGERAEGFKFGDFTFDPGPFYSETVLNNLDVGLYYGIPLLETVTLEKLNIDLGLNLRIYDYELTVRQETSGLDESESGTLPIPMVFVAVQFAPVERFSLEAEGRGISYSGNSIYSLIGRVKVKIFGPVFAAGGYRYEKVDLDEDDVQVEVEISGPFVEAGFSF